MIRLAALASCLLLLSAATPREAAAQSAGQGQGRSKAAPGPAIADPSDWDVVITRPYGVPQKATIKLRNGVIYPAINNNASGTYAVDDAGRLHIEFAGHPKVGVGTAVLERPMPGRWSGILVEPHGESRIDMKRTR